MIIRRGVSKAELDAWLVKGDIIYDGESSDVQHHLALASIVILPSYREGCPRVLLEAGATGRALLATDVPGCREVIIDNHNGYLFEPRSAEALERSLRRMLALPQSRLAEMGAASRRLVEDKFTQEIVIEHYQNAINSISP